MKFSCSKDALAQALSLAERFAGKNVTLPVLGSVLLVAEGTVLTLTATNLEYAVRVLVRGTTSQPGATAAPARLLSALVQSLREPMVELEAGKNGLSVKTEMRRSRVNILPAEEFPLIPTVPEIGVVRVGLAALARGLGSVLPASAVSSFKPELAGVYVQVFPKELRLAATDTARLAEKTMPIQEAVEKSFSFIMPLRFAQEAARLTLEGGVMLASGENQILLKTTTVEIISRTVDGAFPEYRAVIPNTFETSAHVGRDELTAAVRAAGLFTTKLQDVALAFADGKITVTATNAEVGEHVTTIPAQVVGREACIPFNYRYLLDGLGTLTEEEIFIGVSKETAPALFRDKSDTSFVYILMPLRLS